MVVQAEARSVAEAYYAALAALDLDGVAATLAPDVHAEAPGVTFEERGLLLAWMRGFFDAFPGIEHVVDRLEVADGRAEADLRVIGTHTAPLVGPEGRSLRRAAGWSSAPAMRSRSPTARSDRSVLRSTRVT